MGRAAQHVGVVELGEKGIAQARGHPLADLMVALGSALHGPQVVRLHCLDRGSRSSNGCQTDTLAHFHEQFE